MSIKIAIRYYFWSAVAWMYWHLVPTWYYVWWVRRHPKEAEETRQLFKRIADRAEARLREKQNENLGDPM